MKSLVTTSSSLSAAQLKALDYLVEVGGEAYAGTKRFRDQTALALLRRRCVRRVPGGASVLYTKWRITERGEQEQAAHRRRT